MRLGGRMAAAIEILPDIEARRRPVADALKDWGLSHRFAGSGDRAAIGNIVYDVLRRRRSLAWRMEDEAPTAWSLPLCWTARAWASRIWPSLSMATVSRRRCRRPTISPPSGRANSARRRAPCRPTCPTGWPTRLEDAFGEAWIAEAAALSDRPPLDMRVNTLRAERDKVAKALTPFAATATALAPQGLRIAADRGDGRHPNVQVEAGFQKGWFEIQDEGSQIVATAVGRGAGRCRCWISAPGPAARRWRWRRRWRIPARSTPMTATASGWRRSTTG